MTEIEKKALALVPEGQTPLNKGLSHKYLDVIRQGEKARDDGEGSPYHGHSLEHCLHAHGWVQRDLRLALDKAIERHEAFAQEVSDAVVKLNRHWERYEPAKVDFYARFDRFIIPKPVDPLVGAFDEVWPGIDKAMVEALRHARQARGYEWRKIGEGA